MVEYVHTNHNALCIIDHFVILWYQDKDMAGGGGAELPLLAQVIAGSIPSLNWLFQTETNLRTIFSGLVRV